MFCVLSPTKNQIGKEGGEGVFDKVDWVARDMDRQGRATSNIPQKRKVGKKDQKTYDITKDMKATGKTTDWIAKDMEASLENCIFFVCHRSLLPCLNDFL
jgi:hypothetical protein